MTNKHAFLVASFIVSIGGFEESPQEKPVSQYLKNHLVIIDSVSIKIPGFYWSSGKQPPSQEKHPFFPSFFLFKQMFLMKAHRNACPHKTIKNNEICIKKSYREKTCEQDDKNGNEK